MKKYYCKECKKEITRHSKSELCKSCSLKHLYYIGVLNHKGKNNPMSGKKRPEWSYYLINNNHSTKVEIAKKISNALKGKHNSPKTEFKKGVSIPFSKLLYYKNILMRSSWEVKYAQYLDSKKIKWQYEPEIFDLGFTTYRPDFYLPENNTYIEIKGRWIRDAKLKTNLFKTKHNLIILEKLDLKKLQII
jgi:hypothetical protein